MTLIRWTPSRTRNLVDFRDEMDRLLDTFLTTRPVATPNAWVPAVDVEETSDGFVFRADLPGVESKDVKVSLTADVLTIRGERKRETKSTEGDVHRTERVFGSFERSFTLPSPVRGDQVKATVRDGVLEVRVPKAEEARVREIEVQVG